MSSEQIDAILVAMNEWGSCVCYWERGNGHRGEQRTQLIEVAG